MATDNNTFTIVSGYRRIQFAKAQCNSTHIDCRIMQKDLEPQLVFEIILEDIKDTSTLTLAEKAMFLSIASNYFPKETLAQKFFKRLGIKRKQSFLDDLFHLLDGDQIFIDLAHGGLIEEQMLAELLRLKNTDKYAVIDLFSQLNLGASKQKKLLGLLRDAAYKEVFSISDYLQQDGIQTITENETLNIPQIIQHLDRYLQLKIYPQSIAAEKEFTTRIKEITLHKNQKISHSPAFEKDTVTLSTEFASLEQCIAFLQNN